MTTRFRGKSPESRRERSAIGPLVISAVLIVCGAPPPHPDFDMELFRPNLAQTNPHALTIEVSSGRASVSPSGRIGLPTASSSAPIGDRRSA
ncbi:MAG: hypothetical protein WKF60_13385 [Ilumatobacter sp.]